MRITKFCKKKVYFESIILLPSSYRLMKIVFVIPVTLLKLWLNTSARPTVTFHHRCTLFCFPNFSPYQWPWFSKAFRRLRPTKTVSFDIPGCIMKGCLAALVCVLKNTPISGCLKSNFRNIGSKQKLCLFILKATTPIFQTWDQNLFSVTFQKSLKFLCMTICLIITKINLTPVNNVLFKIHIYYHKRSIVLRLHISSSLLTAPSWWH